MANNNLLPFNQSAHERLLSQTLAMDFGADPGDLIRRLYQAQHCPEPFLAYLAQAVAVDVWDHRWPEQQKRDAVNQALEIHRHKGTTAAVIQAIKNQGITATLWEWWQPPEAGWWRPPEPVVAGTVVIQSRVNDNLKTPVDKPTLAKLISAIDNSKRHSIDYRIELELRWDETLALTQGLAPPIGYADHSGAISPLHPRIGIGQGFIGGTMHSLTLTDFEFTGAIT